jgi:hypothetical protein
MKAFITKTFDPRDEKTQLLARIPFTGGNEVEFLRTLEKVMKEFKTKYRTIRVHGRSRSRELARQACGLKYNRGWGGNSNDIPLRGLSYCYEFVVHSYASFRKYDWQGNNLYFRNLDTGKWELARENHFTVRMNEHPSWSK